MQFRSPMRMVHLLLINLTPEAQWMAWRAAQRVWAGTVTVQSTDVETALAYLSHTAPFEQAPVPSLALIATGPYGSWDPVVIGELRKGLAAYKTPLIGLADTSRTMEQLLARRAPLDGVLLSPVQPDALAEMARSLHLQPPVPSCAASATQARCSPRPIQP